MKIRTRVTEDSFGEGEITLNMTYEELQIIGAFLYITRMGGNTVYQSSLRKLCDTVDDAAGDDDFMMAAAQGIDMMISRLDSKGSIIDSISYDEVIVELS